MGVQTARVGLRTNPATERKLKAAADLCGETLTEFVLEAAEERANEVLASSTEVPSDYFDRMLAALENPDQPMDALRRAAAAPRRFKTA